MAFQDKRDEILEILKKPIDIEKCLSEIPKRQEKAKQTEKLMQMQQKFSQEVLMLEFSV
jgi:hypothetical protein